MKYLSKWFAPMTGMQRASMIVAAFILALRLINGAPLVTGMGRLF